MPNWKTKVLLTDIHQAHQDGTMTIQEVAGHLAKRLKLNKYADEFYIIIEELKELSGDTTTDEYEIRDLVSAYDYLLGQAYDIGDYDHRVWFESFKASK